MTSASDQPNEQTRKLVVDDGRIYWLYPDGSHRALTPSDAAIINRYEEALQDQPPVDADLRAVKEVLEHYSRLPYGGNAEAKQALSLIAAIEAALNKPNNNHKEQPMSNFPLLDRCGEKAKKLDMPHFTLIASDNHAIAAVLHWLERAEETGLPDEKYKEAKAIVAAMHDWRTQHPDLCKNPD